MITVHIDGSCDNALRGRMGFAAVVRRDGELLARLSGRKPASRDNSSNRAEFLGLKLALEWILKQTKGEFYGLQEAGREVPENRQTECEGQGEAHQDGGLHLQGQVLSREEEVMILSDSQLLVHIMTDRWRLKEGRYAPVARECRQLALRFAKIRFRWIPRHENKEADALAGQFEAEAGLDEAVEAVR